jgi:hypothetical protein
MHCSDEDDASHDINIAHEGDPVEGLVDWRHAQTPSSVKNHLPTFTTRYSTPTIMMISRCLLGNWTVLRARSAKRQRKGKP